MPNGKLWLLPTGQRALEVGRTARCLRVAPIHDVSGSGWPLPAVMVWRADCIPLPMRYHGGAPPSEDDPGPDDPETTPNEPGPVPGSPFLGAAAEAALA